MTTDLSGRSVGPYKLEKLLGGGVTGTVYLGLDCDLLRRTAVKVLKTRNVADIEQFKREARILAMLKHPNIPSIYQFGEHSEAQLFYIGIEFIEGQDVQKLVTGRPLLAFNETLHILQAVASALDYAHSISDTITHGDVKLENIMVDDSSGDKRLLDSHVYLVDFGFAWARRTSADSGPVLPGSIPYMAPEVMGAKGNEKSDQYSLAVVAYRLLTGRFPFEHTDPTQVLRDHATKAPPAANAFNKELPSTVRGVLDRALSKDPLSRFPDCATFVGELTQALTASGKVAGSVTVYTVSQADVASMVAKLSQMVLESGFIPDYVVCILDPEMPGGPMLEGMLVEGLMSTAGTSKVRNIPVSWVTIQGRGTEPRYVATVRELPNARRILIFDSVSLSGKTMRLAFEALKKAYPAADIRCAAVLIGEQAREACLVQFSAQSISEREVYFPWGLTKPTLTANEFFSAQDAQRPANILRRPWGRIDQFVLNETCTVRILNIESNQRLSLHRHTQRDELFVALDDGVVVEIDGKEFPLSKGDYYLIPRKALHRFSAHINAARVLEIGFGTYDQDLDIERLEDDYGRPPRDGSR